MKGNLNADDADLMDLRRFLLFLPRQFFEPIIQFQICRIFAALHHFQIIKFATDYVLDMMHTFNVLCGIIVFQEFCLRYVVSVFLPIV